MRLNPQNLYGGKRKGAGRKTKEITKLRALSLTEKADEADKSLKLLIEFRDDAHMMPELRRDCAKDIMDRIWGKPKQAVDVNAQMQGNIVVKIINYADKK